MPILPVSPNSVPALNSNPTTPQSQNRTLSMLCPEL